MSTTFCFQIKTRVVTSWRQGTELSLFCWSVFSLRAKYMFRSSESLWKDIFLSLMIFLIRWNTAYPCQRLYSPKSLSSNTFWELWDCNIHCKGFRGPHLSLILNANLKWIRIRIEGFSTFKKQTKFEDIHINIYIYII